MRTKSKISLDTHPVFQPATHIIKTEDKIVDFEPQQILTPCQSCRSYVPHRFEDGKMICDICNTDMGGIYMTRSFHSVEKGIIVVRQERDEE